MLGCKCFGLSFAGNQPCVKHEPIDKEGGSLSTFSQSTDVPHPVVMFENKLYTSTNESTTEQLYTSIAIGDRPENFDQKSLHQMSDHDKPHTFAGQQVKLENQEAEEVRQGNHCLYVHHTLIVLFIVACAAYKFTMHLIHVKSIEGGIAAYSTCGLHMFRL